MSATPSSRPASPVTPWRNLDRLAREIGAKLRRKIPRAAVLKAIVQPAAPISSIWSMSRLAGLFGLDRVRPRAVLPAEESEASMSAKRTRAKPASGPRRGRAITLASGWTCRRWAAWTLSSRPCPRRGRAAKRSDVLRALIVEGLEALKLRHAPNRKTWRASEPDA